MKWEVFMWKRPQIMALDQLALRVRSSFKDKVSKSPWKKLNVNSRDSWEKNRQTKAKMFLSCKMVRKNEDGSVKFSSHMSTSNYLIKFRRMMKEESLTSSRRRWRWIGHVTRQEASIAKTAMHWTPEGKRKRGRPKITWRRTVEKEIKEMGKTWEGIKFMARDRQMWREHVAALHAC